MKIVKRILSAMLTGVCLAAATYCRADQSPSQPPVAFDPHLVAPRFIDMPAMTFAGIATFATPQSERFPELWHHFPQAIAEGRGLDLSKYAYGVELYPPNFPKDKTFTYLAACAVSDPGKVDVALLTSTVPAGKYAVFAVPGSLKGLGAMFHYIYTDWLPHSNYVNQPFDMERYDVSPEAVKAGNMPIEILVPVRDRKPEPPRP